MATKPLPIAGYPNLALAAQDDEALHARTVAALKKAGFAIEGGRLFPPDGADGRAVIVAITAAFQAARST